MKKIVLHSPAVDNAGQYCDAGSTLEVRSVHGDDDDAGKITAERADEMLDTRRAVTMTEAREEAQAPEPVAQREVAMEAGSPRRGAAKPVSNETKGA